MIFKKRIPKNVYFINKTIYIKILKIKKDFNKN